MTSYLSVDDLLMLCEKMGVGPVREMGLLESASHRPKSNLWDQECYTSIEQKAATLHESLVRNHALIDGNKRLGWLATVVLCDINGWILELDDDAAYDLVISVASGEATTDEIASALKAGLSKKETKLTGTPPAVPTQLND